MEEAGGLARGMETARSWGGKHGGDRRPGAGSVQAPAGPQVDPSGRGDSRCAPEASPSPYRATFPRFPGRLAERWFVGKGRNNSPTRTHAGGPPSGPGEGADAQQDGRLPGCRRSFFSSVQDVRQIGSIPLQATIRRLPLHAVFRSATTYQALASKAENLTFRLRAAACRAKNSGLHLHEGGHLAGKPPRSRAGMFSRPSALQKIDRRTVESQLLARAQAELIEHLGGAGEAGGMTAGPTLDIVTVITDPQLFGGAFAGPSWTPWQAYLAALFGLEADDAGASPARSCSGRTDVLAAGPSRESWIIAGRRSGKGRALALIACCMAAFVS